MAQSKNYGLNTMRRAAVWHGVRDVRVMDRVSETLAPQDVRVSVKAVGICGSDAHLYYGEHDTETGFDPFILGHECSGEIVEVGRDVDPRRIGERVAVDPTRPCGQCRHCLKGLYNLCADVVFFAAVPSDGCMAENVVVADRQAHELPEDMSFEAGAMLEPLSCALGAARRLQISVGDSVLVTGAGPIGQMCVRVALALGATEVVVSDVNPSRLEHARAGGAKTVIDARETSLEEVGFVDAVFECSGVSIVAEEAIANLGYRGRAALVGMGLGERIGVDIAALQAREASVTGVFRFANTYENLPQFGTRLALDSLVSHIYDLEDAEKAIQTSREESSAMKVIVHP